MGKAGCSMGARGFDRGGPTELQAEVPLTS
jgi:hypothetical protein